MNCRGPAAIDALHVMHHRKVVASVCSACIDGEEVVKKPRVTLCRATPNGDLEGEQFAAVEVFP
jgi:hypothetical protein